MTLMLRYAARTDVGMLRDNNEDSLYAGPRLLAIADGMGGHAAGEVASRVVVSILSTLDDDAAGGDLVDTLRDRTAEANDHLRAMVEGDPELAGMGTTLTALLFAGNRAGLVHIGDSRAYLRHADLVSQITHDDTFVQALVDEGRITADEASVHPQRSLILRVLTGDPIEPHVSVREVVVGDRYLLCSDGLSDVVSLETMAVALGLEDPQDAADRLVELALRSGGPDNVSCIVADIVDDTLVSDEPVIAGAVADHQRQLPPSADSAAGRAALARPVQPQPAVGPEPSATGDPPRRRLRWVLTAVLALLLLSVGSWSGWRYVQAQYYVGATTDGTVAIFHGVSGDVAGVALHKVGRRVNVRLKDLQPAARGQVNTGITATSLTDADEIVDRLMDKRLPPCPTAPPVPPTSTPSPVAGPAAHALPDAALSTPPSVPSTATPATEQPTTSAPSANRRQSVPPAPARGFLPPPTTPSPVGPPPPTSSPAAEPSTDSTPAGPTSAPPSSPPPSPMSTPSPSPNPTRSPGASPSASPSPSLSPSPAPIPLPGRDCRTGP